MTNPDWERVKELFAEATEHPAGLRLDFLKSKCDGDVHLFNEVSSLLTASSDAENLIENNVIDLASNVVGNNHDYTERHFGNYKIIREVGSGGMGTVFLAERDDGEFMMQVALKIVRQSVADREVIARFKRERQILANLNHPNIAVLHDGGLSEKGEPYLAMEYVDGDTLIEYADKHRLSITERLSLFLKICSAVSYAHRNLVVHRDIKPSNIIVTPDGEPKLLDFGLAKAFESDVAQTQTAVRAFTPAYASPEQIQGRSITTASDVYSLGVVFYELLTGEKPLQLENKSFEEILHTINTGQPVAPSETPDRDGDTAPHRLLKGDLDNIALMALRKEPERRYGSVEDMSADIERHLIGRPIKARPNTFGYLAGKFMRRNKIAVAAASLIILSLVIGVVFTLWQANVARRERDRAEKRFQDVRHLSNSLLFEITPKIENLMGATEAREIVVKRALEYLDSLASESTNDAGLRSELAAAYEKVGDLQGNPNKPNLSNFAGAIESYEKALSIRQTLPATAENRQMLAKNLQISSLVRNRQNDISGSLSDSQRALQLYRDLLAEVTTSVDLQLAAIEAAIEHAQIYSYNNQYGEAVPLFRQAVTGLAALDAGNAETQKLQAKAYFFLGNALSWDGSQTEAETEMAKAVSLIDGLTSRFPNDSEVQALAWQTFAFASSIYEDGNDERSLMFANRSLATAETSVAVDKADSQARFNLARAYSRVGIVSAKLNKTADAGRYLSKSESILNELIDNEPKNVAYQRDLGKLYVRIGDTSEKQNNLADALLKFQNSAVIFEKIAAADDKNTLATRDLAQSLKSVGQMCIKLGQEQTARSNLERAFGLLNQLKAQNALGKFDEKLLTEIEASLRGF